MLANCHMRFSLNSLKGFILRILLGSIIRVTKGDARSIEYSPYDPSLSLNLSP